MPNITTLLNWVVNNEYIHSDENGMLYPNFIQTKCNSANEDVRVNGVDIVHSQAFQQIALSYQLTSGRAGLMMPY